MENNIACVTDIGNFRKNNEDMGYYAKSKFGTLLLVCDGMGGHKKGEVAAKIIVDTIAKEFSSRKTSFNLSSLKKFAKRVIKKANSNVYKKANSSEEYSEMGSTAVLAIVIQDYTQVISIGDSRCYTYSKKDKIKKITVDQTYVEFLYETGRITESERENHPQKNLLLNAMGINDDLENIQEITLKNNEYDSLILCSDGLYNAIKEQGMSDIMDDSNITTQEKAKKMITESLVKSGSDNMTVVIMEK